MASEAIIVSSEIDNSQTAEEHHLLHGVRSLGTTREIGATLPVAYGTSDFTPMTLAHATAYARQVASAHGWPWCEPVVASRLGAGRPGSGWRLNSKPEGRGIYMSIVIDNAGKVREVAVRAAGVVRQSKCDSMTMDARGGRA